VKLFKTDRGPIFCFGFDMVRRVENPNMICWNDPATGEWEAKLDGLAGNLIVADGLDDIEFVRELPDGTIIAYAPGRCLEIFLVGGISLYGLRILRR
jgi:hypothetical protein